MAEPFQLVIFGTLEIAIYVNTHFFIILKGTRGTSKLQLFCRNWNLAPADTQIRILRLNKFDI